MEYHWTNDQGIYPWTGANGKLQWRAVFTIHFIITGDNHQEVDEKLDQLNDILKNCDFQEVKCGDGFAPCSSAKLVARL